MAMSTRGKAKDAAPSASPDQLAAELAELRADLQAAARVTAFVASRSAPFPWTDFTQLLTRQYSVSQQDAERFTAIYGRRKQD